VSSRPVPQRFAGLAIGTGFEFRGRPYVKTGPLTAADPQGAQRLIPRAAVVTVITPETPEGTPPVAELPADLQEALATYHQCALDCLRAADLPAEEARRWSEELEQWQRRLVGLLRMHGVKYRPPE